MNYRLSTFKDVIFKLIVGSIYKFTLRSEKILRKINQNLDKAIDDSIVKMVMPPIEKVINPDSGTEKKKLHIIGNSHAHSFTGSNLGTYALGNVQKKSWDSYSLGPMSSIDLETTKFSLLVKLIEKYKFEKYDYVLLPLGEAECRWYALKNRALPLNPKVEELQEILQPFIDAALRVNLKLFDLGMKPIIWGGHASSRLGPREDKDIPIIGESQFRNKLSLIWETELQNFAIKNNFPFISILPLMLNENLETDENFLSDACHLKTDLLEGFLLSQFHQKSIKLVV